MAAEITGANLRPLDPRVRRLWWLSGALVVAVATAAATALVALPPLRSFAPWAPLVVAVTGGSLTWAVVRVRYRRWRYAISDRHLEIHRGVLWTTVSVVPFARLQFVDTRQGPLDRVFDLASLVVHTAAVGTSGTLPGLDSATAAALRRRLADVADAADGDDDVGV